MHLKMRVALAFQRREMQQIATALTQAGYQEVPKSWGDSAKVWKGTGGRVDKAHIKLLPLKIDYTAFVGGKLYFTRNYGNDRVDVFLTPDGSEAEVRWVLDS
jgi:hypothetical protein